MNDATLSGVRVQASASATPTGVSGTAASTTSGRRNESKVASKHGEHEHERDREDRREFRKGRALFRDGAADVDRIAGRQVAHRRVRCCAGSSAIVVERSAFSSPAVTRMMRRPFSSWTVVESTGAPSRTRLPSGTGSATRTTTGIGPPGSFSVVARMPPTRARRSSAKAAGDSASPASGVACRLRGSHVTPSNVSTTPRMSWIWSASL
jgi:hypothetical protein